MALPYVGEIRMFAGNFAPSGWLFCNGQELEISEYETLYSLIGFTYGGDGELVFALPNLQGRIPVHAGNGFTVAEAGGSETVTLTLDQIPDHVHTLLGTSNFADTTSPQGGVPAAASVVNVSAYGTDQPTSPVNPAAIVPVGGNLPHDNFQPYLCVNFIISPTGIYPSPN